MKPEDIQATKWTLTCTVLNTQTTALTGNVRIDTSAIVKEDACSEGFGVYYSVLIVNSTFCYCSGQITTDLVKNNSCGQKTSMSFIKVRSRW